VLFGPCPRRNCLAVRSSCPRRNALLFGSAHVAHTVAVRPARIVRRLQCSFGRAPSVSPRLRGRSARVGLSFNLSPSVRSPCRPPPCCVVRSAFRAGGRTFVSPTALVLLTSSVPNICSFGRPTSVVHPCCPCAPSVAPVMCFAVPGRSNGTLGGDVVRRRSGRPLSCGAPGSQGVTSSPTLFRCRPRQPPYHRALFSLPYQVALPFRNPVHVPGVCIPYYTKSVFRHRSGSSILPTSKSPCMDLRV
jgi:hypothetical protein